MYSRLDLPVTCHAGEWPNSLENIRLCVQEGVRRIGHGITLVDDKELTEEVVRKQYVVAGKFSHIILFVCFPTLFSYCLLLCYWIFPFLFLTSQDLCRVLSDWQCWRSHRAIIRSASDPPNVPGRSPCDY
jgi:hypothetical protein